MFYNKKKMFYLTVSVVTLMKRSLIEMFYSTVIIGNTVDPNLIPKNHLKYQARMLHLGAIRMLGFVSRCI